MSYRQNIVASFAAKLLPNSLRCSANPETPSATAPPLFILTSSQSCGSSSCWIASSPQGFNVELKFFQTTSPLEKKTQMMIIVNSSNWLHKDEDQLTSQQFVISLSGEAAQCFQFTDGQTATSTVALWNSVHPVMTKNH